MSLFIFILHFLAQVPYAHTAPTQNLTSSKTEIAPPWVDGPNGRGSWDILYSCVFTLSLCVWTAIHPNVPGPGDREHQNVRLKIFWVMIGIFAPEIGVVTAFKQYRQARLLISKLSQLKEERLSKNGRVGDPTKSRAPASNPTKVGE